MPRRILIVRPGALGDSVVTLPLIHALLQRGAERITVLGTPASWAFLAPAQQRVRVLDLDAAAWLGLFGGTFNASAAAELAAHDAAVICLARAAQSLEALRGAGIGDIVVADRSDDAGAHAADRLLASVAGRWQLEHDTTPPALADDPLLAVAEAEQAELRGRLGPDTPDLVVLHPGSGGDAKRWPAERFAALGERLRARGFAVVMLAGPADRAAAAEFDAAWPHRDGVLRALDWPLRQVLALLATADAYVGNDSGITHLAARACPAVALFGPTDPAVWRPLGREVRVLRGPGGKLRAIGVDQVLRALAPFIKH